jgi:hypothetical protein
LSALDLPPPADFICFCSVADVLLVEEKFGYARFVFVIPVISASHLFEIRRDPLFPVCHLLKIALLLEIADILVDAVTQ